MSAFGGKADINGCNLDVRYGPEGDIPIDRAEISALSFASSDVPFWLLKISQNVRSFFARICEPSHKHTSRTGLRSRNGPEEDMEDRVAIFHAAVEI